MVVMISEAILWSCGKRNITSPPSNGYELVMSWVDGLNQASVVSAGVFSFVLLQLEQCLS